VRYFRFQLLIAALPAGGYLVHALTPRGEGRAQFDLPFSPGEARAAWRRIAVRERDLQPCPAGPSPSPEELGEQLFRALFGDEIRGLYDRCVDLLDQEAEAGLRIELAFDPKDRACGPLQALPWELLRRPGTPEFLALTRRQPVVRYLMMARPVRAALHPGLLRIVAVAASPRSLPHLDLARELANLNQAVAATPNVVIVTPAAATLSALRETLRHQRCHVLHFMGHGGEAVRGAGNVVFLEDGNGGAEPVRGTDLANKLADFPSLRLVVLNACESAAMPAGESGDSEGDVFASVANSLVLGGMPAVVAMQFPISDRAAIAFSSAFYQRLAGGEPIDTAVAEGRQEMHSMSPASGEWAIPVLFMRTRTGDLFPQQRVWDRDALLRLGRRWGGALCILLLLGGITIAARRWRVERLVAEGAALYERRQWSAARERFSNALELAPHSAEVLSDLAGTEEQLGDVVSAERHYREAVRWQPESAEHLYNLGHFLVGRHGDDEAYRVLRASLARDPGSADAWGDLASAEVRLKMVGRARVALVLAMRLDPERPAWYRRLGRLELDAGDPKAALRQLMEASRRYPVGDPEKGETMEGIAEAYDRLGDTRASCLAIAEVRRLDPSRMTPWAPAADAVAQRRGCGSEP